MAKNTAAPEFELVVIENFANYTKGDIITDPEIIMELINSEWSANVVKKPKASA